MFWKKKKKTAPKAKGWINQSPVFIYQMGKVGSTSIHYALRRKFPKVVHTHDHTQVADFFEKRRVDGDAFVITGTRDLLRRNVSAFFQNICNENRPAWRYGTRDEVEAASLDDLIAFFDSRHIADFGVSAGDWFDEFAKSTGVNVYDYPFPTDKGYLAIHPGDKVHVFIYRIENLDAALQPMREFLNAPKLKFRDRNVAEKKWYSDIYKDFIAAYRPGEAVLEKVYDSKMMTHFYSPAEREAFKAAWRK